MKTFLSVALTFLAATSMVAAQNQVTSCLEMCSKRMMSATKAEELNCSVGDISCLCQNQGFVFGFRNCANEACTADDSATLLKNVHALCSSKTL